jgi:hypothetical protein
LSFPHRIVIATVPRIQYLINLGDRCNKLANFNFKPAQNFVYNKKVEEIGAIIPYLSPLS